MEIGNTEDMAGLVRRRREGDTSSVQENPTGGSIWGFLSTCGYSTKKKTKPKTVQETQIRASSVLLLPKLLFPIFLLNVGVLLDLLSLISYLRSTRLAGRHLEERGIDSQMARQERQIRAPVEGRDVLEGSVSSGHLSLSQGSAPKALNKV